MRREEKTRISYQEILQAALIEFGMHDYSEVSLNSICSQHDLSKGLFYHYFSGKDEVFLSCVREVFSELISVLQQSCFTDMEKESENLINRYFQTRNTFFAAHPLYQRIFSNAVFQCPAHLRNQVAQLRKPLQELNHKLIQKMASNLDLRESVSISDAEKYFNQFDEIFQFLLTRYQQPDTGIDQIEPLTRKLLDLMLYGIAQQK
ncbi:MAG: TetR/AcrR family transcriptional regulator [Candidatus Merdivicinus sp.]|jgi:TetR/AcrR family transcriptional regulator